MYVRSHAQARSRLGCSNWRVSTLGETANVLAAINGVHELALPNRTQAVGTHQGAYQVASQAQALVLERYALPAAAVGAATGSKSVFQVCAGRAR